MTYGSLDDEISQALGIAVTVVQREPAEHRSTHSLEDLVVCFPDGTTRPMVRKDVNPNAVLPAAAGARPEFAIDPRREIEAYRSVVGPMGIDAPRLLASVSDQDTQRFWLLLERVDGVPLWQVGDTSVWCDMAGWLARLHRRVAPVGEGLLVHDRRWHAIWLNRAVAAAPDGALDPVSAQHERICRCLEDWPTGLVHGECYPSNVLVTYADGGCRFRVVDWEMAGYGPGVLDLAALISGNGWGAGDREALIHAYYGSWVEAGGRGSIDALREAVVCARIQMALQWIGWSMTWQPPIEHAQDWVGEALACVEELVC